MSGGVRQAPASAWLWEKPVWCQHWAQCFWEGTWGQSRVSLGCPVGLFFQAAPWGYFFRQRQELLQAPVCLPCPSFLISVGREEHPAAQPTKAAQKACDSLLHFHPGMKGMIENICFVIKAIDPGGIRLPRVAYSKSQR